MTAATLAPFWMYSKNGLPDVTDAITDRALAPQQARVDNRSGHGFTFSGIERRAERPFPAGPGNRRYAPAPAPGRNRPCIPPSFSASRQRNGRSHPAERKPHRQHLPGLPTKGVPTTSGRF